MGLFSFFKKKDVITRETLENELRREEMKSLYDLKRHNAELRRERMALDLLEMKQERLKRESVVAQLEAELLEDDEDDVESVAFGSSAASAFGLDEDDIALFNIITKGKFSLPGMAPPNPPVADAPTESPPDGEEAPTHLSLSEKEIKRLIGAVPGPLLKRAKLMDDAALAAVIRSKYTHATKEDIALAINYIRSQ